MTDWRTRLRESDPARDAEMAALDVQRIRSVVVSAANQADRRVVFVWPRAFVAAAAALVLVCVTALTALHRAASDMQPREAAQYQGEQGTTQDGMQIERTQLQFTTPGGTRIIWVFDTQFDVKGTLP